MPLLTRGSDALATAHKSLGTALDVFTKARDGLVKAIAHYDDEVAQSQATIDYLLERQAEATAHGDKSRNILSKIESLTV